MKPLVLDVAVFFFYFLFLLSFYKLVPNGGSEGGCVATSRSLATFIKEDDVTDWSWVIFYDLHTTTYY
jgi:hypothetical protein